MNYFKLSSLQHYSVASGPSCQEEQYCSHLNVSYDKIVFLSLLPSLLRSIFSAPLSACIYIKENVLFCPQCWLWKQWVSIYIFFSSLLPSEKLSKVTLINYLQMKTLKTQELCEWWRSHSEIMVESG